MKKVEKQLIDELTKLIDQYLGYPRSNWKDYKKSTIAFYKIVARYRKLDTTFYEVTYLCDLFTKRIKDQFEYELLCLHYTTRINYWFIYIKILWLRYRIYKKYNIKFPSRQIK